MQPMFQPSRASKPLQKAQDILLPSGRLLIGAFEVAPAAAETLNGPRLHPELAVLADLGLKTSLFAVK